MWTWGKGFQQTTSPGLATGPPAGPAFGERAFLMCSVSFPWEFTDQPSPAPKSGYSLNSAPVAHKPLYGERDFADVMK